MRQRPTGVFGDKDSAVATRSEAPGLARLLSAPRLTRYVRATGGDLLDALALYEWNTSMSGALFEALQGFEVIFRNAVHEQLSATHSAHGLTGQWYDDPRRVLDERARDDIAIARSRAGVGGRPPTPGHIIAELGLGFWRFLFARRYTHSLWVPSLRHAFPGLAGNEPGRP